MICYHMLIHNGMKNSNYQMFQKPISGKQFIKILNAVKMKKFINYISHEVTPFSYETLLCSICLQPNLKFLWPKLNKTHHIRMVLKEINGLHGGKKCPLIWLVLCK